ncbi:hypothetical protein U1Q18_013374, partial [Sarracenia purpurea var. burkii]
MASPSHSEIITRLELASYVPKPKNDDALILERYDLPVVIPLIKQPWLKETSRTPNNREQDLNDLSFKLPRNCFKDIFVMVEQHPIEAQNAPIQGSRRTIFWSRPINFRLPDDIVHHILNMDQ